jgi:hypothetical protein
MTLYIKPNGVKINVNEKFEPNITEAERLGWKSYEEVQREEIRKELELEAAARDKIKDEEREKMGEPKRKRRTKAEIEADELAAKGEQE